MGGMENYFHGEGSEGNGEWQQAMGKSEWLDSLIAGLLWVVYRWKKPVKQEGKPFTDIALWFSLED